MQVIAHQGDTVDSLCWRHLGSTDAVETVIAANPGLAALGATLPHGTTVTLPEPGIGAAADALNTNNNLIQLWD